MAEENEDGQEKSEDPTDERRQEFRNRGDIAHSKEFTSVAVLVVTVAFLSIYAYHGFLNICNLFISQFEQLNSIHITKNSLLPYLTNIWKSFLAIIIPISLVTICTAIVSTFLQTNFNFSWSRVSPNWNKFNPLSGLKRMFSSQALLELFKSVGKMVAVGLITYLILYGEQTKIPALLNISIPGIWSYWGEITRLMFWFVSGFLFIIASIDYFYNYSVLEKKMKMTKQEVKDEFKQRELNPLIKGRQRRIQREMSMRQTVEATKTATVIITNPTHYSVALKYELGMESPVLVAKGIDHLALTIREVAKSFDIPLVENRPLARALYKTVEVDQNIPESLYKAVSEIIRYVFRIKGIKVKNQEKS